MKISNKIKTLAAGGLGVVAMGLQSLPVAATGKVRCPNGDSADDLTKCNGIASSNNNLNNGKVKTAKNTIMYGIIGLIIALLAFSIVNFVLTNLFKTSS